MLVTKSHNRGNQLSNAEGFNGGREAVGGVGVSRNDLTVKFGINELLTGNSLVGPPGFAGLENLLVKDVVVAEVSILTTQTCVMLQDTVDIEIITDIKGYWLALDIMLRVFEGGLGKEV